MRAPSHGHPVRKFRSLARETENLGEIGTQGVERGKVGKNFPRINKLDFTTFSRAITHRHTARSDDRVWDALAGNVPFERAKKNTFFWKISYTSKNNILLPRG